MSEQSIETATSLRRVEPEDQAGFYNEFLSHFLEQRGNVRCKQAVEWAKRWVRADHRVLEVGCGIGDVSAAMGNMGASVLAIDLADEVIEWAKANQAAPGVTYECADARTIDLSKHGPFDRIVFSDSVEHIPAKDRPAVIAKVCAQCGDSAIALIAWPNPIIHKRATLTTYQPVDERVEVDVLLAEFRAGGFNNVDYVQSWMCGTYMRAVLKKTMEPGD